MLRNDGAEAADIVVVGILRFRVAPRGDGIDVQLFKWRRLARNSREFFRFSGRFNGAARCFQRIARAEHLLVSVELETWPVVARSNHRDAPPRHRRIGVEFGCLAEAALCFEGPEGVQLRDSLIEKGLRLRVRGRDWKTYPSLPLHE